ncbi:MAG: hypothetical protein IT260_00610 [Saprospiraceae bacterium]|nr:hypothetical protein [Saprospiraceae bacterium]
MFYSFFNRVNLMAYAMLLTLSFVSCHKDAQDGLGTMQSLTSGPTQHYPISLSEVLKFYASGGEQQGNPLDAEKIIALEPKWDEAFTGQSVSGREILVVPLPDSMLKSINHGRAGARLLFSKYSADSIQADLLVYVADSAWHQNNSGVFDLSTFTGALAFYDVGQHFRHAMYVQAGVPIAGTDLISTQTAVIADDRDVHCQDYTVSFITSICTDVVIALDCPEVNVYINTFTFQHCTTVYTGGGGSGTGGNSGGGGSGGSNNGGNGGGNSYNPYTDFALLFNGTIPLNVFLANGGQLPEGYTSESFKQLVSANNSFKFTPRQIDSLLKHPEYIPIIYNALFNPVGEEAAILKEVLDFALAHGLTPTEFQYLLLNYPYFQKIKHIASKITLNTHQLGWLIANGATFVTDQVYDFIQDTNIQDPITIQECVVAHLSFLIEDPEYAELNEAASLWPPWFWEIGSDILIEIAEKVVKKQLGITIGEDVKNAIRDCGSFDILGCLGNTFDVMRRFFPALKFVDLTFDAIEFGGKAKNVWKAIEKVQAFGEDVGSKFWTVLKTRCGNWLENFKWVNNATGASLKNSGSPLSFWDDLENSLKQIPGVKILTPGELAQYELAGVQLNHPYGHKITLKYGGNTNPNGYTLVFKLQPGGGEFKIRFD